MNYNQITIGIVTYKSEKVLFDCLKSIKKIKNIIIFDNSNDTELKKIIDKRYPKIRFIKSKKNLGYGTANNRIVRESNTKFVFILNPDVILKKNCEQNLLKSLLKLKNNFSVLSPFEKNKNHEYSKKKFSKNKNLLEVNYANGFALLINKYDFKKIGMFDENIFLYNEEIDLFKRLRISNLKIYIDRNSEVKHLGGKSSNIGNEFDKCRNWHWMWSQVYFQKKYKKKFLINIKFTLILFVLLWKIIFYFLIFKKKKAIDKVMRFSGTLNAILGRSSWYRPKLN
jgi:N-acetylglucosaminyl-diphospho-decaprenol L-rhamnosyltransferase